MLLTTCWSTAMRSVILEVGTRQLRKNFGNSGIACDVFLGKVNKYYLKMSAKKLNK